MRRSLLALLFLAVVCPRPAAAFTFYFASGGAATGDHQHAMVDLIQAFKADYPDAKITYDISTSYIKPITETLMQDLGNQTPDVAVVGLVEWPILLKHKLLWPLNTVLSRAELKQVWGSLLPAMKAQTYGKDVKAEDYALPFNRGTPGLYVNVDLLPELAAPKKATITWDELEQALRSQRRKSRQPDARVQLTLPLLDDWVSEALLMSARGGPTIDDIQSHFGAPEIHALVQRLRRLREEGLVSYVAHEREAYDSFIGARSAAMLVSSSAYASVRAHSKFSFRVLMPPSAGQTRIDIGGGDLVLPASARHTADAKTRRDIHDFLLWFYSGKGAALWARSASMFALTSKAQISPEYKAAFSGHPNDAKFFIGSDGWKVQSFYTLNEYCNILKIRQAAQRTFNDALAGPDASLVLSQADAFIQKILADPGCP